MKKIQILDCTLRDGGFINNWNFGEDCIVNIIERLELAGIDIIEIGYLRDYIVDNINMTQFSGTRAVSSVCSKHNQSLENRSLHFAIIDFGSCAIDNIEDCAQTVLDGIRVTFKLHELDDAISFCSKLKKKGYLVSLQPVSFMDYTPQNVLDLVKYANDLNPYAVCIVDTYGFMNKRDLLRYYSLMDTTLNPDIILGYHSHNNFQLAYSNAVELMEQFTERRMIVDCSVMGMGKGAGNAATELIAMYLNQNMRYCYNVDHLLEIADTYIEKMKGTSYWGYSLKYFIAALNKCHHQYVSFLQSKKTLSVKSINEIIMRIPKEYKTKYNEKLVMELYHNYQAKVVNDQDDYKWLSREIYNRNILIIAPGKSILEQKEKIFSYIESTNPYIIHVNHSISIFKPNAIFISNHKRYAQIALIMKKYLLDTNIILTSNINPTTLSASCVLNYSDILVSDTKIADNSTLMLLNALKKAGVKSVSIAGFDGYNVGEKNYFSDQWDFKGNSYENNEIIKNIVNNLSKQMNITFITDSLYQ